MNMIELGLFLLCLTTAAFAWVVGSRLGTRWYCGVIAGAIGFFLPIMLAKVTLRANRALLNRRPPRPLCENGKCKWDDYHVVKFAGDDVEFVCKCGQRYLKSGPRFFKLREDEQREPYKVLNSQQQWEDDMRG